MSISGVPTSKLGIRYSTHVQSIGWQGWKSNGQYAGTTGQAKRIEAIKIKLTGSEASKYDIYYRVHSQTLGWLGWASNGSIAGTTGLKYRVEAIQVMIVAKGDPAPGSTRKPYVSATYKGIDVSHHQGDSIDWNQVAASGYYFAMIRVQNGTSADKYFSTNIKNANLAGLKIGAYSYSLATNVQEAEKEAKSIISKLRGLNISYPVVYDIENDRQINLSTTERTNMVLAFKRIIEANGYDFLLYANKKLGGKLS